MSYIVPREKPKRCNECPFMLKDTFDCRLNKESYKYTLLDKQYSNCPLVEVPSHGRLIDADAFDERVRVAGGMSEEELTEDFKDGVQTVLYMLSKQHTIIEAEGSDT